VSDQANFKRLRQVARRLRMRKRRQARRLLEEAHRGFLTDTESQPPNNESHPENFRGPTPRNTNSTPTSATTTTTTTIITTTTATDNNNSEPRISVPSPSPSIRSPSPPSYSPISSPVEPPSLSIHESPSPSRPYPPSPPEPDSPHSVLTLRVRPDTPPRTPSMSPPSCSPIQSPRPTSPTNSALSVEFIDEFHIPPPRLRHYCYYNPHESLKTLITQFPQRTDLLPSGSYTIGPDDFDLIEIREIIATQDSDSLIPIFLPNSLFPYDIPVRFFYNLFPPSTITINEIQP